MAAEMINEATITTGMNIAMCASLIVDPGQP